jgi:DNA-binding CsgD family transcriptional regulator
MTGMPQPPLVGRVALVERLSDDLDQGRSILLRGPPGIGKTRLAGELVDARPPERPVERLLASPVTRDRALGALAPLLPPSVAGLALPELQAWLLRHWRQRRAGVNRATLLWLDDAQQLDPTSWALLRHAVTLGTVQLLATHRSSDPPSDELVALRTEGLLLSSDMGPLDPPDTIELARACAGRPLTDGESRRIVTLSAGNPLFVRELAGMVARGDDVHDLHTLGDLVGQPVRALDDRSRRTLELVAAAEPVPARLLEPEREQVASLLRAGLVQHQDEDLLRVDHPLRGAWALDQVGPIRQHLYRVLLERARRGGMLDELDPVAVADWYAAAGESPPPGTSERAARLALARSDPTSALRIAEQVPTPAKELIRAIAMVSDGDLRTGLEQLDQVRRSGPLDHRLEASSWQARYLGVMFGEFDRAHAVLDDVDRPELSLTQRRLHSLARAWLWIFDRNPGSDAVQGLLDLARADPPEPTSHALLTASLPLLLPIADPAHCLAVAREIRGLEAMVDPGSSDRGRARAVEAWSWLMAGHAGRAVATLVSSVEEAVSNGDAESATLLGGNVAIMGAVAGRVDIARRTLRAGHSVPGITRWLTWRELAELAGRGNQYLADRGAALDDVTAPSGRLGSTGATLALVELFRARARTIARAAHHLPDDREELLGAIRRNGDRGQTHYVVTAAVELLDVRDRPELHRVVLDTTEHLPGDGLAAATAELSRGRLGRDTSQLLAAATRLERMGVTAGATHAAADVLRVGPAEPETVTAARRLLVRVRRRWRGAEPWWVQDVPGVPTPYQVDVAVRVAELDSVDEVARERTVSRRTVENHVYRVTRALGLSGRDELVEALAPRGGAEPVDGAVSPY